MITKEDKLFALIQIYLNSYNSLTENKENADSQVLSFIANEIQEVGTELRESIAHTPKSPDSLI